MSAKPQGKRVLKMPKRRGSIPHSKVSKAIKEIAAARRRRKPASMSDGWK
jgi:hypothetical protein